MAKEPYKDPFPGLRAPRLFAAETPCHKALREIAEIPGSPVTCLSPFGDATEIKTVEAVTKSKRVTKSKIGRPKKGVTKTPAQRAAAYRASKKLGARSPNPA